MKRHRLVEILQDIDGQLSSKRVLAFLAFGGYVLSGVAYFFGHMLPEAYVTGFEYMTLGCVGLSIPEQFGTKVPAGTSSFTSTTSTTSTPPVVEPTVLTGRI